MSNHSDDYTLSTNEICICISQTVFKVQCYWALATIVLVLVIVFLALYMVGRLMGMVED
jgi:hypothetical protein